MERHYGILFLILMSVAGIGQVKWDGEAGDGQWQSALNWVGDQLPGLMDDVVLDNSIIKRSYQVSVQGSVSIKSLIISCDDTFAIEVTIPRSNILNPAFTASSRPYGLVVGQGGIFKNASGAAAGSVIIVSDSIKINNGGKYVHHSTTAHAGNVSILSRSPGTEMGIFEFDNPDASTTISLSNRVFGSLILSASFGAVNYTATGTGKVTVRGNLKINPGASLNLNLSDTLVVGGDLHQRRSVLNLGTATRSLVLLLRGHLYHEDGSSIRETGSVDQSILFAGHSHQRIQVDTLISSIIVKLDNDSGATLQRRLVMPHQLHLIRGVLVSDSINLLVLSGTCSLVVDSLGNSFIRGPMRKSGLITSGFLFPVGHDRQRWISLKEAVGSFTIEYCKGNPNQNGAVGGGLHHISSLEFWKIFADSGSRARTELSFADPHSGGVTNLSHLRVARLTQGMWEDAGNAATTGTAGHRGSVVSDAMEFHFGIVHVTLGSDAANENSLPLSINFTARLVGTEVVLSWQGNFDRLVRFDIEVSNDMLVYRSIKEISAQPVYRYTAAVPMSGKKMGVRIKVIRLDGTFQTSPPIVITAAHALLKGYVFGENLWVGYRSEEPSDVVLYVIDLHGRVVRRARLAAISGNNVSTINIASLPSGLYQIFGVFSGLQTNSLKFLKK